MVEGLLDTGGDDAVFSERTAADIGLDLSGTPAGSVRGIGSPAFPVRYAEVTLRVAAQREFRQWRATVGFTPAPLPRALLGFAGFLQFFTATFYGDLEQVELTINSLYPGT